MKNSIQFKKTLNASQCALKIQCDETRVLNQIKYKF